MESKLAELYNELGEKVVSIIPVRWEQIYYLGEVEPGKASWSSVLYFKEVSGSEYVKSHNIPDIYNVSEDIYEELIDEASEILLEIYDCFLDNDQKPWEQLSLSIDAEGNFNIDYLYETISQNDMGPVERETVWAYNTFGNIPKEGTYMRRVLDSYLEQ